MTGSVVRYGSHRISINTNTGLRDICGARSDVQKSQSYSVSHFFKVPMSMTIIVQKAHAFRRRIDAEALSHTCIQEMEHAVLETFICSVIRY